MKKPRPSLVKINVITLGCSKNLTDSEVLLRQLDHGKFQISHDSSDFNHDIVIINTCGFINDAKQESIDTILEVTTAKRNGQVKKIIVTGCLSARYYDELKKEIPEVDAYFGVNNFKEILEYLGKDFSFDLMDERILTTPSHYAYLKIAEGCDRSCSFCAIPLIRGRHISKPVENIIHEATLLAEKGVKELILIAQDLTYYGVDIYQKRALGNLLEGLSIVRGIEWIRLQYAYPTAFPLEILKVMNSKDNICNYLDIPFQHINDSLLKSMNRGIDSRQTYKLIETIRKEVPGIALRTSLIAGYPGETDKEFNELLNFVKEIRFDRLGVFLYSHEEGTKAYCLKDNISNKVKQERADVLMHLQETISQTKNEELIGKTLKVIIDRKEGEYLVGRTEYDSPEVDNEVLISEAATKNLIGQFKKVLITGAETFDLFGKLV